MSKYKLILSGSPRRGGNSDILCDRFMEGARESGHRAEKDFLRDKNIGYCLGCEACHQNNGVCVQKDDMAEILGKMIAADVIVMATPVYFYTMDAQMKTLIDRCVARYTEISNKAFYFIATAADGSAHPQETAHEIQPRTGTDTRATILGHVQRGGSPTLRDRVNASAMGYHAVCLLEQGKYNRIVGMKGEELVDYPVDEALEMTKSIDPVLVDVCNTISI